MEEHKRLAQRRKHAERSEVCVCGRRVFGNGRLSHYRTCGRHLAERGWPVNDAMRRALFDTYRGGDAVKVLQEVQRRLGGLYLERRRAGYKAELSWREFRELFWQYADEAHVHLRGER